MASRREFLQGAIAASALPLIIGAGPASPLARRRTVTLYKAVYDERFAPARSFARQAQKSGIAAAGFKSDITNLWFADLHHRWRKARTPVAVAGITAPSALFCLERLAWDHGMRVIVEARHVRSGDGSFSHQVLRGGTLLNAKTLAAAGSAWPALIANAAMRVPAADAVPLGPTASGVPADAEGGAPVLVSFVIAPVRRT
jgi:hypothetical protein